MIPFNRSTIQGDELEYIRDAVESGQVSGDQKYSKKCQRLLEAVLGCRHALVTTSCTHALEMGGLLLDIGAGDEVILPSFTFVSTANAFALRGARLVFADIRADTKNLDETLVESLITPRTRAIIPVHYAGVACEMDTLADIATRWQIPVIEDNAHGLFGRYKGRWLGTLGSLATQSFHETKNITCGEGGALIVNDTWFADRAEVIREKGTNRARFFRGQIDKYSWVDIGSSYVMSDVLAAFLYGQLEKWQDIQAKREALWNRYDAALRDWADPLGVEQPFVPTHCEQAWHMYYLVMPTFEMRTRFISHLKASGITAVFHYLPLHLSEYAKRWGGKSGDCPVTESVAERLVRLPFYTDLLRFDQERVIDAIRSFGP